jgi:hypothetical protein
MSSPTVTTLPGSDFELFDFLAIESLLQKTKEAVPADLNM